MYNPLVEYPHWASYGVNPFSLPALFAAVLCLINFLMVWKMFPETKKFGEASVQHKSINPFKLFRPLPYTGVNATNLAYFFFITAFSGMEFTLTFLAVERLSFTSMDNAYMFIYIGFIIAFVQGGYVRRRAHQVGEKKMSMHGLICIIPGLVILAFAHSKVMLYFGLAFLAMGSAMIIPCLTSLVSFYTPRETQGRSLGIFRSLGSLGRVIGPIYASLVYWRFGSVFAYMIGAITLLIPLVIVRALPVVKKGE
jgi:MFS family permease